MTKRHHKTERGLYRVINRTPRRHLHKAMRIAAAPRHDWRVRLALAPMPVRRAFDAICALEVMEIDRRLLSYAQ